MSNEVLEVQHRTFPKSVQPGLPKLKPPKPGWKTYRFGELLAPVQRRVHLRAEDTYDLVTVKRSRGGIQSRGKLRGSQISVKSQFRIEEGDFLIFKRQIVHGACGVVTAAFEDSIVSNEYSVLRCKPILDLNFLGYLTHSVYFQQTCFHSSIGVHIEKMIFKLDEWLKWPVNIPTLPEQQKIAAFLGAVDAKIAALVARQSALGRFKAGLMQKLFSQQLRFTQDDGRAFPDWQEKRLGDLGIFTGGGTPDTNDEEYWNGEIPWVSSSDIIDNSITCLAPTRGISMAAIKMSATKLVPENSILIVSRVGVGKLAITRKEVCTSQDFCNFTPSVGNIVYLAYWLKTAKNKLLSLSQGTSIKGLSTVELKALNVDFPDPDEQQKIADALSAMDGKIQAVGDQIAGLEIFKKGLLQQMFV